VSKLGPGFFILAHQFIRVRRVADQGGRLVVCIDQNFAGGEK